MTDKNPMLERCRQLESRCNGLELTCETLEARVKAAERVAGRMTDLYEKMSDMRTEYTELYAKTSQELSTVRGSIAVQAREAGKKLNLPTPMYALVDMEEVEKLRSLGMNEKQINEYAAMKVKMEQVQTLIGGGSRQIKELKKEGDDTLKSSAPPSQEHGKATRPAGASKGQLHGGR